MKFKKQILSLIMAVMIVINCSPYAYAINDGILTIGNIYDAITNIEYGWDGTTYRFSNDVLTGVKDGDDVYLVADSSIGSNATGDTTTDEQLKAGSKLNLTLTNFRLNGTDADKYEIPADLNEMSVEKEIEITKKKIIIAPQHPYIYYGQSGPDDNKITELVDYKQQIVNGDDVNIEATFKIDKPNYNVVGAYSLKLDGQIIASGAAVDNYDIECDEDLKFNVFEYETEKIALPDGATDNYVGVNSATLCAPDGFLISKNSSKNFRNKKITIPLEETNDGKYTYYLRNNNTSDPEYYQAITKPKTYEYKSVQTIPQVKKIKLEKVEPNTILNFLSFGVFGNGKIVATVCAEGGKVPVDTTIYLGENDNYESKVVTADKAVLVGKKYIYSEKFEFDVEKEKSITKNLKAYAENVCGAGGVYPPAVTKDTFDGTETKVNSPVTIDKKKSDVEIIEIDGNYNHDSVRAVFTVSDPDSGIKKIEYLWDNGFLLKEGDSKYQTDYVELNINSDESSSYELVQPWSTLKTVEGNRHTLYLRVTDNAGNVYDAEPVTDVIGSDMLKPNIESIVIKDPRDGAINEKISDINYLPFGTFFKYPVDVIVKVNDNEDKTDYYATGVKKVYINGTMLEEIGDTNEFILRVDLNTRIDDLEITAIDGNELSTKAFATEVAKHGALQSNNLMIEEDCPLIDFDNFENMGHKDNEGNIWFGENDKNKELIIKINDNDGSLHSGLHSVVIKDIVDDNDDNGDNIVYSNNSFVFQTNESEIPLKIESFSDGKHNLIVEVIDNCGNVGIKDVTFYKDIVNPEIGKVSTESPKSKTIDSKLWFNGEDDITFRIDTSDDRSGVKEILLTINGVTFNYNTEFDPDDDIGDIIFSEDGKCYVQVSTKGVPHKEQKYEVTGTITDFANNTANIESLTVYKDFKEPTIEKITVEKKSDALDKILKVLTFGVYSNDALIIKAYTQEPQFDSGIDYATIQYTGLEEPQKMIDEGNGVFSFEVLVNDKVFESDVVIKVYDKYGKENCTSPKISNVDGNAFSNDNLLMIETVDPIITPNLPTSNVISRNDNQVWYADNKEITFDFKDVNSGLNNIDLTINGENVTKDKNGIDLLKSAVAENAGSRNNVVERYAFDTDYFTSICGEAADGKYVINVKATDNAGNSDSCTRTYYLDKTSPVIDSIDFIPETADGKNNTTEFIEELEYGYYFKTDFNVTVNVSDKGPSAGLYKVNYKLVPYKNGQKQEAITGSKEIVDGKAELVIPKGFKGQIFVEAFDCVLRSSGEKTAKAYVVDTYAPDIKIINNVNTDYHDANGNKLYVETNSFTVVITDTVSGIKQIGYLQNAEKNPYDRKTIDIANIEYVLEYDLGDGWLVTGVDANLVTQVTKVFTFPTDDNDVVLTFDATDNSQIKSELVKSEKFTVDKTAPIINVVFRDDDDTDEYYNQNRVADITVVERNFDANLIKVAIENTFGDVPTYSFTENSKDEHTTVINFDEGDYTFDLTGTDLGAHSAIVNFSGGNEKLFYVDKTRPTIEENFSEFINSAENSFNVDKTVNIKVVEHNFSPKRMNLKIFRKDPGAEHSLNGFEDVTSEFLGAANWRSTGDLHTVSFTFARDAVYYVEITPVDLATNSAEKHISAVFEIDKTNPVVSMKNGSYVGRDNTSFLDVYPYERKDDAVPTVEFEDFNISFIKYKLSVYIPEYTASNEIAVNPVVSEGIVEGNKYTLPEFTKDGVYAVELTAVDIAGNESALNLNTYARMTKQDVLAFIMDNNLEKKTGLYSFEYENGQAISKKPSSFKDLKIYVMAKKDTPIDIVMRDANGKEILTNAQCTMDDSIYGIGIYNYLLKADFFKENFQDDVDIELILSVNNDGRRIDLGKMHIDNIVPTSDIPEDLASWHWFFGEDERTFTLSNISELVNESQCKVYDNGKAIPFVYSEADNTITFKLSKGWHNVGFVLVDMAGNTNNIQEKTNIHIGYFWLWIIIAVAVLIITITVLVVIYNRNRKKKAIEAF